MLGSVRIPLFSLALTVSLAGSVVAKCPVGDLNGDCQINLEDLQVFAGQWLVPPESSADLNGDDDVDMADFTLLATSWYKAGIPLVINEVLASNSSVIRDPQGQYDDWIEIHNYGDEAIDVGGMYLTDDLSAPAKWQVPDDPSATTIPAQGYLVIWVDNDIEDTGLHANFRLDAGGEELGLVDNDGCTLIDAISFGDQATDISYGHFPDASYNLRFMAFPTPGGENIGIYLGFVTDPKFSHDHGFYNAPFSVTITTETEGVIIYYTLDGSEPYDSSGRSPAAAVYTNPIGVTKTTCLRATAVKHGWMPSSTYTQTYIFLDDVIHQPARPSGFPSSWGSTSADYEMDADVVNNPEYGPLMDDALLSIPTFSIVLDTDDMFGSSGIYTRSTSRGIAWERPGSAELIYPDGSEGFQVNCGIRIQGGYFRSHSACRKHSLRLLFKGMYGPTKLTFPLFGQDAVDSFDTITLRAGANDGYTWNSARGTEQYTRDEFARTLQQDTGNAGSHGTFAHLYINGLYWGLYNPCERPDGSFSASYYGGEKEDWDVFTHKGFALHQGNRSALNQMQSVCQEASGSYEAYQKLQGKNPDGTPNPDYPHLLDVPNYADYMIVNYWAGNWDWPWNNYWLARKRTSDSTGFKFYCWDTEDIMLSPRSPLYMDKISNPDSSDVGQLHGRLRQNPEYRLLFADRIHSLFFNGGILTADSLVKRYADLASDIEMAIVTESARWGDQHHGQPVTQHEWYAMRDQILNSYLPQRSGIVLQQFRDAGLYPDVDAPVFHINGSYQHGGHISPDDLLSVTPTTGTIYYTRDGCDPRLPETSDGTISSTTLVAENAAKRVLVPTGPINDNWKGGGSFDDLSWTSGSGGVGYERGSGYEGFISIDVEAQMYNKNATCYIRIPFTVNADDLAGFNFMTLEIRYDDAFVAHINGVEVDRRNFTGTPAWNSGASSNHSDSAAVDLEDIDVSAYLGALRTGDNILAIHGLNDGTTSSDLLISVNLSRLRRGLFSFSA